MKNQKYKLILSIIPLILFIIAVCFLINNQGNNTKEITTISIEDKMNYESNISSEGKLLTPGEKVTIQFKVKNMVNTKKENMQVKLIAEGSSRPLGKDTLKIDRLLPNEEANIQWQIKGKSGGTKYSVEVKEAGKAPMYLPIGGITVAGKGWFQGDNNIIEDSAVSNETLTQKVWEMRRRGINYISITESDNNSTEENKEEVYIKGKEVQNTNSSHSVVFNTKNASLIYAAHPCEPNSQWKDEDLKKDISGIEVWNGDWSPRGQYNKEAFSLWDKLNREGAHLYGVANVAPHSVKEIGKVVTNTYADEFTADAMLKAQKEGHSYGTNGPIIDMRVNNTMMGDSFPVNSYGDIAKVILKGEYSEKLSKVKLIRNGEIIADKNINDNKFSLVEMVKVKPGDFIRMEVEGVENNGKSLAANDKETAPFAFSNPIFMIKKK